MAQTSLCEERFGPSAGGLYRWARHRLREGRGGAAIRLVDHDAANKG